MAEYTYYKPVYYDVAAAEILKEIGEQRPHMLLRIGVRGGHFPHRDAACFALISSQENAIPALFCEVDDDEQGFRAYFATDVPLRGTLAIGFENEVTAEFDLERLNLEPRRLEEGRIDSPFHRVTLKDLGMFDIQR